MTRNPVVRACTPVLAVAASAVACIQTTAPAQDCAATSFQTPILREPLDLSPAAAELRAVGAEPHSLLDIKRAAAAHDLELEGRECSLQEALSHGAPVVLALREPDHFVTALNQDGESVQILDNGVVGVTTREALSDRFAGVALFPVVGSRPGPRVEVPGAHYDAGRVPVGDKVVHTFEIRNTGTEPLTLRLASSPCCGMTAALDIVDVAPGEAGHVVVGMVAGLYGPMLRSVTLGTSDPNRRLLWLTVAAHTAVGVNVFPEHAHVIGDNLPNARERWADVHVYGSATSQVTELSVDGAPATAEVVEEKERYGNRECRIEVRPKPATPPGDYAGRLIIKMQTEEGEEPISIPVKLAIRANAVVNPPRVYFGFIKQGEEAPPRRVRTSTRSQEPYRISDAAVNHPRLSVSRAGDTEFRVAVDPTKPGVIAGHLILTTDIALEETIRIPVYAHVLPR